MARMTSQKFAEYEHLMTMFGYFQHCLENSPIPSFRSRDDE